ncbi:hypothetical protein MUB24_17690 [Lederbergia sp. NSJ-179]|uniref:hypothetical protein n=1 Tax=Lederbergia sp. NSJ-179 TaxID=2931402 RepID=UPI001FD02060|nr:hypothetical protein [Lederbergia sp. NSJ-179]MCJ7842698.1 hypothetical protein [Lederbergia sp. NSJ-179]
MSFIKLGLMEGKKLFWQREIYIALFLCTLFFVMAMISDPDPPGPLLFWKTLVSIVPYIGYWFIAILIVVGVARCLPFDREQKMEELMLTYKKGRLPLLMVKQAVIFIYCALIVLYFYLVAGITLATNYDTAGLFTQTKLSPNLSVHLNPEWTFAQLLLYEYGYMVLASYIFALFIFLLSLCIKRSVYIMMMAGSIFAGGEIFDKVIAKYIGTMELSNYLTPMYEYGFNGMLGFQYLGSFSIFSASEVYGLFLLIACLLFMLNLFTGRWRRYGSLGG